MPQEPIPTPAPILYHALKNIPVPIQALCEAGLSPTQWVLLYILHYRKQLEPELQAMVNCPNKALLWYEQDLRELLDRFYLIHEPVAGSFSKTDAANFRPSVRFTDLLATLKEAWLPDGHYELARPREIGPGPTTIMSARHSKGTHAEGLHASLLEDLEAFDALFQAYPSHIPVNGTLMSGRGGDYDGMAAAYAKALTAKNSPVHATILELVSWARQQNLLTMGLQKFIGSREWLGLQELRDQGFSGSTFDSQTAI